MFSKQTCAQLDTCHASVALGVDGQAFLPVAFFRHFSTFCPSWPSTASTARIRHHLQELRAGCAVHMTPVDHVKRWIYWGKTFQRKKKASAKAESASPSSWPHVSALWGLPSRGDMRRPPSDRLFWKASWSSESAIGERW